MQFRRMIKRSSKDADVLDFEKEFGFSPESILTRVERQLGGWTDSRRDFNVWQTLLRCSAVRSI